MAFLDPYFGFFWIRLESILRAELPQLLAFDKCVNGRLRVAVTRVRPGIHRGVGEGEGREGRRETTVGSEWRLHVFALRGRERGREGERDEGVGGRERERRVIGRESGREGERETCHREREWAAPGGGYSFRPHTQGPFDARS